MKCIDCGEVKPIMLTQTATVGRWKREWTVCVGCALAWEHGKKGAR